MIEAIDLQVQYDHDIDALNKISFKLEGQHCIGIIGENGSGKSTLLSSLVGLTNYNGHILVDNLDLKDNLALVRAKLGYVFQNADHQLFMSSVYQDLAFGLRNQKKNNQAIKAKIDEVAKMLSIEKLLNRPSAHLSGGQKALVSLATVLVLEPEIILLDEPTSHLDPKSRRMILNLLKQLPQLIIMASHDLDLALDICDEIILLNQGKIKAQGKARDILTNEKLLLENGLELPLRLQR